MAAIPIAWGIWDKYRTEARAQAREVVAVNAGIAEANAATANIPPVPAEAVPAIIEKHSP